jgi:hypothetical protein
MARRMVKQTQLARVLDTNDQWLSVGKQAAQQRWGKAS